MRQVNVRIIREGLTHRETHDEVKETRTHFNRMIQVPVNKVVHLLWAKTKELRTDYSVVSYLVID